VIKGAIIPTLLMIIVLMIVTYVPALTLALPAVVGM